MAKATKSGPGIVKKVRRFLGNRKQQGEIAAEEAQFGMPLASETYVSKKITKNLKIPKKKSTK